MNADEVKQVGIVGAGLMGHGIALVFALGGYEVRLNDLSQDALRKATDSVKANLETLEKMGLAGGEQASGVPERIRTSTSLADTVADADVVIEAVFEDLPLKLRVFAELDEMSPERTVLASNTSTFMASQLAPATGRADRVVVANWWNPPYLLPLVEVVRGPMTSDDTIETLSQLLSRVGKQPVVLQKESLGFIGNRMQIALLREAISIVEQGIASAEDVDTVVKTSFGRRMAVAGPLEVFDIAGWDVIRAIISQLYPEIDSSEEVPTTVQEMVDRGDLGLKSGKGFYTWTPEAAAGLRQRVAQALATIERLSRSPGTGQS